MTLEKTLLKFFQQGNDQTEFPKNLRVLHEALRLGFVESVTTLSGNRIIISPIVEGTFLQLQGLLASQYASPSSISSAGGRYISSYISYATFLPTKPPAGFFAPHIGILMVSTPIPFSGSVDMLDKEGNIPYFAALMKAGISSTMTIEFGSQASPTGLCPAPPLMFPLRVVA